MRGRDTPPNPFRELLDSPGRGLLMALTETLSGPWHGARMRVSDRLGMAARNLLTAPMRSLLLIVVIAFSCGFLFLVYSFYMSFRVQVVERLLQSFPVTMVEIRQRPKVVGAAEYENPKAPLTITSSRALARLPVVKKVYYEEVLRVASLVEADFGLATALFESPVYGISEDYVRGEPATPGEYRYDAKAKVIPALISQELLDVFNAAYVAPRGLARYSPQGLRRMSIQFYIGRNGIGLRESKKQLQYEVGIIGTSTKVQPIGLNVPFEYVRQWNREFLGARYHDSLSRLILEADSPEGAEVVAQRAEAAGFEARTGREAIRRVIVIQNVILAGGSFLGALILALALVSVGSMMLLSVNEQRSWIGLQRALGARKADIYGAVLLESFLLSALACMVGLLLAAALGAGVNEFVIPRLPTFRLIPKQFFMLDPFVGFYCWAGVCLFSALATLPAARRAVNVTPIEALSN